MASTRRICVGGAIGGVAQWFGPYVPTGLVSIDLEQDGVRHPVG